MPSVKYLFLCLGLWALLAACGPSTDKKDSLLLEAADYHNQATEIQAVVEPQLDRIDSLKTVLSAQKATANTARITTLDSLKTAFEDWEKNLTEVPGMAHEHKKGEHHHADATLKDLPADQMRNLQRETLNNIRLIQGRLNNLIR